MAILEQRLYEGLDKKETSDVYTKRMLICSDVPMIAEGEKELFDLDTAKKIEEYPATENIPAVEKKGSLEVGQTASVKDAVAAAVKGERVLVDEKFRSDFEEEYDRVLSEHEHGGEPLSKVDHWIMKGVDKVLDKVVGRKLTAEEHSEGKVTFIHIDRTSGPVHVEDLIIHYQDAFKKEVDEHAVTMKNAMSRILASATQVSKYPEGLKMAEKQALKIAEDKALRAQKIQETKEKVAGKILAVKEAVKGFGGRIKGIFKK